MNSSNDIARYLENWQDEIESAFLYRALAKVEAQPALFWVDDASIVNYSTTNTR
jgi:DNA-binding phage protein